MNLNNVDISKLPADVRKQYKQLQVMYAEKKIRNLAKDDFLSFVKCVWPEFVEGAHHRHIAKKFNELAEGKINRLIVNMPPRHTKSEFASFLLPAWMVGRNPKLKIIQATHTGELAVRFGRKAKTLIDSDDYRKVFDTTLREDSQAAGRWETAQGGEYFAAGVGGAITGRGADLLIIDDPHSEQDAMSATAMESAYEWYTSGPRQRLQPGGKIVCVMTRWSTKDLTGMLVSKQKEPKADQWHVVEFPAIMDHGPDKQIPVWPEYWNIDELEKVKATLPIGKWNAQWMQQPTSEEGAIIKREWWRKWKHDWIPDLHHVIQSYDTAFMKKETADYSAITTWGVFYLNEDSPANLILLDCVKERFEFPDLRRKALEQYKYWQPETVIIEAKASGLPLTYELRQMDIPVSTFTPSRGNDKHVRVNTCAPLFESGMIWAPEQNFAEEVIEECAAFPHGDHDDLVDSMTMAVMRFRQGGFISHPEDYVEEKSVPRKKELLLMSILKGIPFLRQELTKIFMKRAADKSGIMTVPFKNKKLQLDIEDRLQKYILDAQKQGVDLDMVSNENLKYTIKLNENVDPISRAISADSPEGRRITEMLLGKRGEVVDMTGKKLDTSQGIMGGKSVKELMESGQVQKGTEGLKKSKKVQDREMFENSNLNKTDAQIKAEIEASNKKSLSKMETNNFSLNTITKIKSMKPMDAMKEANLVAGKKGRYANLDDNQVKKIIDDTTDHIFERDIPIDPEDMADGGVAGLLGERTGYQDGLKVYPKITASKSNQGLGDGKNVDLQDLTYGGMLMYDQGPFSTGIEYLKGKDKFDFKDIDDTLAKDTTDRELANLILMMKLKNGLIKFKGNKDNQMINISKSFAKGGRARQNFAMGKRAFLKLMGGVGAGIAGLKSGLLGFGKGSTKKAVKELTSVPIGNPEGMPSWFKPLVNKIIKEGDDVTKKFGTVDREIVHTKKIDKFEEVTVYQDLNTGNVRIEYGPHLTDDTGKVIRASNEPTVVQLEYKAPQVIEPNLTTGKGGGKTKEEFYAAESEPEIVNWDGDIEMSGINEVNKVDDLITDTSKLKKYATDNKLTIKELSESMKKQKYKNKLDSDLGEQINYIENKSGMNAMDYIDEGARVGDFDPKGYRNYDTKGINLPDKKADGGRIGLSTGGLAAMLGE